METDIRGVADPVRATHGRHVVDPDRPAFGPGATGNPDAQGKGGRARCRFEGGGVDPVGMPHRCAAQLVRFAVDRPQRAQRPSEAVGESGEDLGSGGVDVFGGLLRRGGNGAGFDLDRGLGLDIGLSVRECRSRRQGQVGKHFRQGSQIWRGLLGGLFFAEAAQRFL